MTIHETTFGPKRYLTLKKSISTEQVTDKQMYDDAGKKLGAYIAQHGLTISGPWSVLYFTWDNANKKTDIGIAFPIDNLTSVEDPELSIVDIPQTKASMDTLKGSYEGLGAVHGSLMKYVGEQGFNGTGLPAMAIEEYTVGPMQNPAPESWETHIYYLHN